MNLTYTLNEPLLIEKCVNGDRKCQKELYDRFSSKMFSVCLRYSKNSMDAEDILQEGFIKLFNNLSRFRGEGSFDGWVRRIFVNTAIEHIRRKSVTTTVSDGLENSIFDKRVSVLDTLYKEDIIKKANTLSAGSVRSLPYTRLKATLTKKSPITLVLLKVQASLSSQEPKLYCVLLFRANRRTKWPIVRLCND